MLRLCEQARCHRSSLASSMSGWRSLRGGDGRNDDPRQINREDASLIGQVARIDPPIVCLNGLSTEREPQT